MERNSFVFYRSFYDAVSELDSDQQAEAYWAICQYAFDGIEPECKGVVRAIFKLVKPQIDANNRKRENGKQGGRPINQDETKTEPNDNQEKTEEKPNNNLTITKIEPDCENSKPNVNVNVNANVNANVNVKKEKHKYGTYKHVLLTDEEYYNLMTEYGGQTLSDAITFLDEYIEEKGYKSKSHNLALRRWVFDAIGKKKPKALPYSGIEF